MSLNQVLNACVAILFVSTITTCGVEGNKIPLEEDPVELSVDVSIVMEYILCKY